MIEWIILTQILQHHESYYIVLGIGAVIMIAILGFSDKDHHE